MSRRLCFILSAFLATFTAWAGPGGDEYMRMARLSYIMGHVSFQHASDVDWSAASVNLPLESEDRIYTGPDGRAEIEFDDGSIYRLAENTDVEILSLREDLIQLRILAGLSTLTAYSGMDFEINTPAAAFNARHKGVYRFSVGENGNTEAIVRKGDLEAASNYFSRRIESGERLRVSPGDSNAVDVAQYDKRDGWDEWNDRRNADLNASYASRNYLPSSVYMGAAELDRYGQWVNVDSYGYGWVPYSVGSYWSPYYDGRWCYRPFYGWTWISYEPWGWLPYHYGRWHHSPNHGWCWLPGASFGFNFWSPGLASFYIGPGWISWCPLGPGDYYNIDNYYFNRRIHGYQRDQLRGLHTRPPGDPFNRHAPGAFQTAQIDHFRNGSFDNRNRRMPGGNIDQPWNQGSLVRDRLAIQPTSASYSAAPDRAVVRPKTTSSLPAVVRTSPRVNAGGGEQFSKITNPRVSSTAAGTWQIRSDPDATVAGRGQGSNSRVVRVPGVEHTYRSERVASGNTSADRGVRTITAPRESDSLQNSGSITGNAWRSAPATESKNAAPRVQQNSYRGRYERITPERTIQSPALVTPRGESPQQNSYSVLPRVSVGGSEGNAGARIARTPEVRRTTIYSAPRQSVPSFNGGQNIGSHSFAAPSSGRGGGNASSSIGRSSGGISSGRQGGSPGKGHNSR